MNKIYLSALFIFFIFCVEIVDAQLSWRSTNAPLVNDRYDDTYFLNADTGWAVTLYSSYGGVYHQWATVIKTTDGGNTWQTMLDSGTEEFRDIAFLNAQTGYIGTLENNNYGHNGFPGDTSVLYQTHDGGATWAAVTNLPGPDYAGICGMRVIDDSTLYAVGRYFGPAGFYKTTDAGNTWTYTDMSAYASGLVDVYFFNADTGFVCGAIGYDTQEGQFMSYTTGQSGIILYTTNGGNTWQVNHITGRTGELCWKMSFPSRLVGYASIETFNTSPADSQYCLKTTDGGLSWHDVFVCQQPGPYLGFDEQGIGFINDSVGWVGGRNYEPGLSPTYTYKTTDGGSTWNADNFGSNINRFRFLSDSLAYFSGSTIYKYSSQPVTFIASDSILPIQATLYPNPANTILTVKGEPVGEVSLFDVRGELVACVKHPLNNQIDVSSFAPGTYVVQIEINGKIGAAKWIKY